MNYNKDTQEQDSELSTAIGIIATGIIGIFAVVYILIISLT